MVGPHGGLSSRPTCAVRRKVSSAESRRQSRTGSDLQHTIGARAIAEGPLAVAVALDRSWPGPRFRRWAEERTSAIGSDPTWLCGGHASSQHPHECVSCDRLLPSSAAWSATATVPLGIASAVVRPWLAHHASNVGSLAYYVLTLPAINGPSRRRRDRQGKLRVVGYQPVRDDGVAPW